MELYAYICIYSLYSQIRTKLYNHETAWPNVRKKKVLVSDFIVKSYSLHRFSLLTMKMRFSFLRIPVTRILHFNTSLRLNEQCVGIGNTSKSYVRSEQSKSYKSDCI